MENLNAEQIKKALECCIADKCTPDCAYYRKGLCGEKLKADAFSLIEELTEENERLKSLCVAKDDIINKIAKNSEEIGIVAIRAISETKADTVRKMQERIAEHATNGYPRKVRLDVIDQIAKEMKGEDK